MNTAKSTRVFWEGVRDGTPIGLGYFAVAFSLGIVAKNAGLNAVEGFVASFFNVASAGEYALFTSMQAGAAIIEVAIATVIINARYLLMSCSLSQKMASTMNPIHRFFVGFGVTDEIFGISIARKGFLNPMYNYGAMAISIPLWAIGTSFGIMAGNFLPLRIVNAFSVALYGMFVAIIVPPAKQNTTILISIIVAFLLSYTSTKLPYISDLSSGTRIIALTIAIASVMAIIKPIKEEQI